MGWEEQDKSRENSFEQQQRRIATESSRFGLFFWRQKLIHPSVENLATTEFIIRGHHLKYYKRLADGEFPQKLANECVDNDFVGGVYKQDLVGDLQKDSFITRALIRGVFERYKRLSREAVITINTTYDHICNSCKVGLHCRVMDPEGRTEDGLEIWQVYRTIVDQGNSEKCKLNITLVNIPEHVEVSRDAILTLRSTKGELEDALQSFKNWGVCERHEHWQDSIDEMLADPKVSVEPVVLNWSWNERRFTENSDIL